MRQSANPSHVLTTCDNENSPAACSTPEGRSMIARAVPLVDGVCVYALWREEKAVYVGWTTDLTQRLGSHRSNKVFDKCTIYRCNSIEEAKLVEAALVFQHKPKDNRDCPAVGGVFYVGRIDDAAAGDEFEFCVIGKRVYARRLGASRIDLPVPEVAQ